MESGPSLWLILLTLGVVALGGAMAYGMLQNRKRTRSEKAVTDTFARREARAEDRDDS